MIRSVLLASIAMQSLICPMAIAQEADEESADAIENIFVVGQRRAYQGNFDNLETPAANQSIDLDLLRDVGALNLNDALDLSASVARQNNFGGYGTAFRFVVSPVISTCQADFLSMVLTQAEDSAVPGIW